MKKGDEVRIIATGEQASIMRIDQYGVIWVDVTSNFYQQPYKEDELKFLCSEEEYIANENKVEEPPE